MPAKTTVPPGGFLGWASQTMAVQALLRRPATRKRSTTRRKKRAAIRGRPARRKPAATRRKVAAKKSARPARLVKGSAAAKRHVAKLRKMRKK